MLSLRARAFCELCGVHVGDEHPDDVTVFFCSMGIHGDALGCVLGRAEMNLFA